MTRLSGSAFVSARAIGGVIEIWPRATGRPSGSEVRVGRRRGLATNPTTRSRRIAAHATQRLDRDGGAVARELGVAEALQGEIGLAHEQPPRITDGWVAHCAFLTTTIHCHVRALTPELSCSRIHKSECEAFAILKSAVSFSVR